MCGELSIKEEASRQLVTPGPVSEDETYPFSVSFTILHLTKQKDVPTMHHHHQLAPSRSPIPLQRTGQ
jgi:hypothetical protein